MRVSEQADKPTKDRILDVASELFANKGFFAVSVRTIAAKVGIKESSLYHHFGCKEHILKDVFGLFKSVLDDFFYRVTPPQTTGDTLDTLDPEEFLKREQRRYIRFWDDPAREKLWFVVSIEKYRNHQAAEMILQQTKELQDLYEVYFRKWVGKKLFGAYNPRRLAEDYVYSLLAMHSEYRLLKAAGKPTRTIEQNLHAFIRFFLGRIKV